MGCDQSSSSAEAAEEALEQVIAEGSDGKVFQADVSSFEATSAMFDAIEAERGPVDLLVTNAGIAPFKDDADMPIYLWGSVLNSVYLIRFMRVSDLVTH